MAELRGVNLNRLAVFVAVVEAASITGAARRLGLAKAMVSKHLQRLEAELGASLVARSTRRLSLTDAGASFYAASRRIVQEAEEAIAVAGSSIVEPRGTLRVSTPVDYGADVVTPVAATLAKRYPGLTIELVGEDRVVDLIGEGFDVAVRIARLPDSSLRALQIGRVSTWLVASPALLGTRPAPRTLEAAAQYPFVALSVLPNPLVRTFTGPGGQRRAVRLKPALWVNTAVAVREAALSGAGIALMSDFAATRDLAEGRLLRLVPNWTLPSRGIHVVFAPSAYQSKRLRVFIEALKSFAASRELLSPGAS